MCKTAQVSLAYWVAQPSTKAVLTLSQLAEPVDDWRAAVVDALSQYTTSNGSWDNVKTAFVEGWATQYANEH